MTDDPAVNAAFEVLRRGAPDAWITLHPAKVEEQKKLFKKAVETHNRVQCLQNGVCPDCGGDCSAANPPVIDCPMKDNPYLGA